MSYKRWSISYTRSFILTIICLLVVLAMMLFLLTAGLRCVDKDGCLREHCKTGGHYSRFIQQYQLLLFDLQRQNPGKCRIVVSWLIIYECGIDWMCKYIKFIVKIQIFKKWLLLITQITITLNVFIIITRIQTLTKKLFKSSMESKRPMLGR